MKKNSEYIGEDLILIQPSFFKREYEFRSSNQLLAKMYFPKFFSLTAVVEGFDDKYEIIRPSFWKADIAIKKFGYDLTFAALTTNFFRTKGSIDLQNGKKIHLKFGAFKKSCQVFSEMDELLLIFQNKLSLKEKNVVTIQKSSALIDENPWVVMMIWYLILQNRKNGVAS
ncbi:MAG: hypothetical protein Q8M94_21760 [Ignavibacteria bacterium]|nr:hypothetical protein [Ignavibacteria bacterium]